METIAGCVLLDVVGLEFGHLTIFPSMAVDLPFARKQIAISI